MDSTRFSQPNPIERLFNRLFGLLAGWGIGLPHNYLGIRQLVLIRLLQQGTMPWGFAVQQAQWSAGLLKQPDKHEAAI